jgi:hypothetical protein
VSAREEYWFRVVEGKRVAYVVERGDVGVCFDRVKRFNPNAKVYVVDKPPAVVLAEFFKSKK